ncbi:MAG: RNA methyltransferase [Alphaproteobacteria bacterium]|nr:RNA methyltransferase [Alphaproteobacteria bacterium]
MNNLPCIILIEPQLAENIGMTARAMMNCGIAELRLVKPRENHLSDKAIAASSNAEEILYNASVYSSTEEAISDINWVLATTARHRDQIKPIFSAEFAATDMADKLKYGQKCGILFGPERTGLHNKDVCLSNAIINIPLNPKHCSLNLSQAVLLVGYEFYKTQKTMSENTLVTNNTEIADKEKTIKFCEFFEDLLSDCGAFKLDEKREKMVINLRNIFTRNQLTKQEIDTLYGAIRHLCKK